MTRHYCIHGLDHPQGQELRNRHYAEHRAFLERSIEYGVTICASGPLMSEDGEEMIGSLFIVEADSEAKVRTFNADDPFARDAVWRSVVISRFHLRLGSLGQVSHS